ncbi:MAG: hypothetical protein KA239_01620 [Bacteroidia bacterium]|nr:hypothetical protein [Bacteroidia bacterium]
MKINIDLSCLGDGERFQNESYGGIIYAPFNVLIGGKAYPAQDWEDYPIVNLRSWAEQILLNGEDFCSQVFTLMDDAWEMRWQDCDVESQCGTLYMIHSGLGVILWSEPRYFLKDFAKEILKAINFMIESLEKFIANGKREPSETIQNLKISAGGLSTWMKDHAQT